MTSNNSILGYWKIIWMKMWDQEYVNLVVTGYIKIHNDGNGDFQFGVVTGSFNADSQRRYFCSKWEGESEMDEALGEIYGTIDDKKGELCGAISFWDGDESDYRAIKILENKAV